LKSPIAVLAALIKKFFPTYNFAILKIHSDAASAFGASGAGSSTLGFFSRVGCWSGNGFVS
jgi:hypothetical protein